MIAIIVIGVNIIDLFNTISSILGNIIGIVSFIISILSFLKMRKIKTALEEYKKKLLLRDICKEFDDQQELLKKQIQNLLKLASSTDIPIKSLDFVAKLSILAGNLDSMLSNYASVFELLGITREQQKRIWNFIVNIKDADIDKSPQSSRYYISELEYIKNIICKERNIYDLY